MAFCKFSTEYKPKTLVSLESAFITDYMPLAPDICTKVFLHGLFLCSQENESFNSLQAVSETLNISQEDVKSAFLFWKEQGLVTVLNLNPIEVRYLPIVPKSFGTKLFDKEKYADFNLQMQEVLDGRMITPHEYKEYYITMESMHIEQMALVMIAKYCTNLKKNNVGYSYILTVAKNWAYEGVHTVSDTEKKLLEMENVTSIVKEILICLKIKKAPTYEDRELYNKWTKTYGFDLPIIMLVAKKIKRGGMAKLDERIESYKKLNLFSEQEIKEYEECKDKIYLLAKNLCNAIGLYYDNLEPIISTYILKWQQMGYADDALLCIAKICFKKYIRNFEGMDETISKYYAKGIISINSIDEYIRDSLSVDKQIKDCLNKLNISRQVTSWDRDFYRTWTYGWNFNNDMIDYALSLGVGKSQPMNYVNKILSNWKEQGVDNLDKAKSKAGVVGGTSEGAIAKKSEFMTHSFSMEELDALFDNLDEVKLI